MLWRVLRSAKVTSTAPPRLADDGIGLPVTDTRTPFNHRWPLVDAAPVFDLPATVMAAVALPRRLLAAQVFVEVTIVAFVGLDILVYPFMTDRDPLLPRTTSH